MQHMAGSLFVKQILIFTGESKFLGKVSVKENHSYRNLWSTRKINFCRAVYRIRLLFDVLINWRLSVSRTFMVFLTNEYDKGYS